MPGPISQPTHKNIHVDVQAQIRQLWQAVRHAGGGGFDPNETPVIIGATATAGGGSTPNNVSAGALWAVAVGFNADAEGQSSVAIGNAAAANTNLSIAIGRNAAAGTGGGGGLDTIAIGDTANAYGDYSIAIGVNAAIGLLHDHSVALGYAATTTKAHQIMLGTAASFVEIPGNSSTAPNGLVFTDTATGTRYIMRVTSGAVVLSAAP